MSRAVTDPALAGSTPPQPLVLDGITHSYGAGLAVDDVTCW